MTAPGTTNFICNLCGADHPLAAEGLGREVAGCSRCGSSSRHRALAWLISDELFGVPMAMPDFPAMKSWTALGMSDVPGMAEPLAAKFSYTNTFYHQPPLFDVMVRDPSLDGRFDFIVSSEVLEHVPHPVGPAFDNLFHMLKPSGVLFLTVPYTIDEDAVEHFPSLHDFAVVALKERWGW